MDLGLCDGRDYLPAKRICIATTLKHPPNLGSWIRYHAQAGVERMYLYFDEPDDPAKAIAGEHPAVAVLDNLNREVDISTRLEVNLMDAISRARGEGMDWIVHLDDDELLCPFLNPLQEIFDVEEEVYSIVFHNREVVKTHSERGAYDFFATERYFFERGYLSYQNGKSAGNLSFPDLAPLRQHRFDLREPSARRRRVYMEQARAVVLHYPFCVFEEWKRKCLRDARALGNMEYYWLVREEIERHGPEGEEALSDLYGETVEFSGERLERLLWEGTARRLDDVCEALSESTAAVESEPGGE